MDYENDLNTDSSYTFTPYYLKMCFLALIFLFCSAIRLLFAFFLNDRYSLPSFLMVYHCKKSMDHSIYSMCSVFFFLVIILIFQCLIRFQNNYRKSNILVKEVFRQLTVSDDCNHFHDILSPCFLILVLIVNSSPLMYLCFKFMDNIVNICSKHGVKNLSCFPYFNFKVIFYMFKSRLFSRTYISFGYTIFLFIFDYRAFHSYLLKSNNSKSCIDGSEKKKKSTLTNPACEVTYNELKLRPEVNKYSYLCEGETIVKTFDLAKYNPKYSIYFHNDLDFFFLIWAVSDSYNCGSGRIPFSSFETSRYLQNLWLDIGPNDVNNLMLTPLHTKNCLCLMLPSKMNMYNHLSSEHNPIIISIDSFYLYQKLLFVNLLVSRITTNDHSIIYNLLSFNYYIFPKNYDLISQYNIVINFSTLMKARKTNFLSEFIGKAYVKKNRASTLICFSDLESIMILNFEIKIDNLITSFWNFEKCQLYGDKKKKIIPTGCAIYNTELYLSITKSYHYKRQNEFKIIDNINGFMLKKEKENVYKIVKNSNNKNDKPKYQEHIKYHDTQSYNDEWNYFFEIKLLFLQIRKRLDDIWIYHDIKYMLSLVLEIILNLLEFSKVFTQIKAKRKFKTTFSFDVVMSSINEICEFFSKYVRHNKPFRDRMLFHEIEINVDFIILVEILLKKKINALYFDRNLSLLQESQLKQELIDLFLLNVFTDHHQINDDINKTKINDQQIHSHHNEWVRFCSVSVIFFYVELLVIIALIIDSNEYVTRAMSNLISQKIKLRRIYDRIVSFQHITTVHSQPLLIFLNIYRNNLTKMSLCEQPNMMFAEKLNPYRYKFWLIEKIKFNYVLCNSKLLVIVNIILTGKSNNIDEIGKLSDSYFISHVSTPIPSNLIPKEIHQNRIMQALIMSSTILRMCLNYYSKNVYLCSSVSTPMMSQLSQSQFQLKNRIKDRVVYSRHNFGNEAVKPISYEKNRVNSFFESVSNNKIYSCKQKDYNFSPLNHNLKNKFSYKSLPNVNKLKILLGYIIFLLKKKKSYPYCLDKIKSKIISDERLSELSLRKHYSNGFSGKYSPNYHMLSYYICHMELADNSNKIDSKKVSVMNKKILNVNYSSKYTFEEKRCDQSSFNDGFNGNSSFLQYDEDELLEENFINGVANEKKEDEDSNCEDDDFFDDEIDDDTIIIPEFNIDDNSHDKNKNDFFKSTSLNENDSTYIDGVKNDNEITTSFENNASIPRASSLSNVVGTVSVAVAKFLENMLARNSSLKKDTINAAIQDCYGRFILNLPQEYLANHIHLCFAVQEAFWWYDDYWFDQFSPSIPKLSMRNFGFLLCELCPLLRLYFSSSNYINFMNQWRQYCRTIPLRGAILLNNTLTKVLMVQGWKGGRWMFPRGKVDELEDDVECAIREVKEEVGVDVSKIINPHIYIEINIDEQPLKLYVIPGLLESTPFGPRKRKEIGRIRWVNFDKIPGWNQFYKKWDKLFPHQQDLQTNDDVEFFFKRKKNNLSKNEENQIYKKKKKKLKHKNSASNEIGKIRCWNVSPFVESLVGWVYLFEKGSKLRDPKKKIQDDFIVKSNNVCTDVNQEWEYYGDSPGLFSFRCPPLNFNALLAEKYAKYYIEDANDNVNSYLNVKQMDINNPFAENGQITSEKNKDEKINDSLNRVCLSSITVSQPAAARPTPLPPLFDDRLLYRIPMHVSHNFIRKLQNPLENSNTVVKKKIENEKVNVEKNDELTQSLFQKKTVFNFSQTKKIGKLPHSASTLIKEKDTDNTQISKILVSTPDNNNILQSYSLINNIFKNEINFINHSEANPVLIKEDNTDDCDITNHTISKPNRDELLLDNKNLINLRSKAVPASLKLTKHGINILRLPNKTQTEHHKSVTLKLKYSNFSMGEKNEKNQFDSLSCNRNYLSHLESSSVITHSKNSSSVDSLAGSKACNMYYDDINEVVPCNNHHVERIKQHSSGSSNCLHDENHNNNELLKGKQSSQVPGLLKIKGLHKKIPKLSSKLVDPPNVIPELSQKDTSLKLKQYVSSEGETKEIQYLKSMNNFYKYNRLNTKNIDDNHSHTRESEASLKLKALLNISSIEHDNNLNKDEDLHPIGTKRQSFIAKQNVESSYSSCHFLPSTKPVTKIELVPLKINPLSKHTEFNSLKKTHTYTSKDPSINRQDKIDVLHQKINHMHSESKIPSIKLFDKPIKTNVIKKLNSKVLLSSQKKLNSYDTTSYNLKCLDKPMDSYVFNDTVTYDNHQSEFLLKNNVFEDNHKMKAIKKDHEKKKHNFTKTSTKHYKVNNPALKLSLKKNTHYLDEINFKFNRLSKAKKNTITSFNNDYIKDKLLTNKVPLPPRNLHPFGDNTTSKNSKYVDNGFIPKSHFNQSKSSSYESISSHPDKYNCSNFYLNTSNEICELGFIAYKAVNTCRKRVGKNSLSPSEFASILGLLQ